MNIAFLIAAATAATPAPTPAVTSHLTIEPCTFAEVYQFETATCEVTFLNTGKRPIHISGFKPLKPNDGVAKSDFVVPPLGSIQVGTTVAVETATGLASHYFVLDTDETGRNLGRRMAEVSGFVDSVLDDGGPTVDLKLVELGGPLAGQTYEFKSTEFPALRIGRVLDKPDYLDVAVGADGRTVTVTPKADAPWGIHRDIVKLAIDSPVQKAVGLAVEAQYRGDVIPGSNPFVIGEIRQGNVNEFQIPLTSRSGKEFQIGPIKTVNFSGKVDVIPCQPLADACKALRVRIGEDQPLGFIRGVIDVSLPDYGRSLPINVGGFYLAKNTVIRDLDEEKPKTAPETANASTEGNASTESTAAPTETPPPAGPGVNLRQAFSRNVRAASQAAPVGEGPLLKWSVANERFVYGYTIHRAEKDDGPFVRLNKAAIRRIAEDDSGSSYQWRDNTAEHGKTYWYYIGLLYEDGRKQALTSPQKVVAK